MCDIASQVLNDFLMCQWKRFIKYTYRCSPHLVSQELCCVKISRYVNEAILLFHDKHTLRNTPSKIYGENAALEPSSSKNIAIYM